MAEEQKRENEKEIQAILSDLDAILSNLEGAPQTPPAAARVIPKLPSAAPPPETPPALQPTPAPEPVMKLPPISEPSAAEPPPEAAPPAKEPELKIELGPRPVKFKSAAKKPEAAKPLPKALASEARPPLELGLTPPAAAAPVPAAPAPAPGPAAQTPPPASSAPAPQPAPVPAPGAIPDNVDTDLVRRVAFVCAPGREQENAAFVASLHKAALTISRKPLYLREVLNEVLSAEADVMILAERIRSRRAVATLGVLEGLPEKQIQALSDSMGISGIVFKPIKLADIDNRSMIVDLLVDLMILSPES